MLLKAHSARKRFCRSEDGLRRGQMHDQYTAAPYAVQAPGRLPENKKAGNASTNPAKMVRQYKPKPNRGKDIRFGFFSCLSQIHFYCNVYNLGTFILNFAYNFTLADI